MRESYKVTTTTTDFGSILESIRGQRISDALNEVHGTCGVGREKRRVLFVNVT